MSTMRALQLAVNDGSKPSLTLETLPRPILPPNNVLVKICAASINPSDILNSNGGFSHTTFPRVPGRDYSGVVTDGPAELIGKEVYGTSGGSLGFASDGAHAEYLVIPVDAVAIKPANLSFVQAASVGVPFTTAALALRRAMVKSTDIVLVLGASGAVGSAAAQIAKSQGCKVLTAFRKDSADVNLITDPELKTVKDLTSGHGADVVIDTVGSLELMSSALLCLAQQGRFSYISAPRKGSTEFTFDMKGLYRDEKMIIGCNSTLSSLQETASELRGIVGAFETGQLQVVNEKDLELIGIEKSVEAYEGLKNGERKKFVIVF